MNLPLPPTCWDIEQLTQERTEAIGAFGFTERQARFLVEVLIHSGVFVERQYCAFAGITHGQKTTDFLRRLVERGYARPIHVGALHRGRLFHSAQRHRLPVPVVRLPDGGVQRLVVDPRLLQCRW